MKNLIFLSLFLLLLSCKKDVEPEFTGTASIKVDGQTKQLVFNNYSTFSTSMISMSFKDADNTSFNLTLQKSGNINSNNNLIFPFVCCDAIDRAGANLVANLKGESFFNTPTNPDALGIQQGRVLLIKWTESEVEGTFSFIGVGQINPNTRVEVTEGKFFVKRN